MESENNCLCPICGSGDYKLLYPATSSSSQPVPGANDSERFRCTSHYLANHPDIVECSDCGLVYNNPQPDPGALMDIYKVVEDPLYLEESGARVRTFSHSLNQLHRFGKPPGKLLDVGCYTGVFMEVAAKNGWEVEGVELSSWAAEIARKKGIGTVYEKPLDRLRLPENRFDAVTLWDVIEHLTDPAAMLRDVHRVLKPGGVIAISTHMVDSWAVRLMGTRYPFFMEMHVVHFSRETMKQMLENEGYEFLKIMPHRRVLRVGYFLEKLSHKFPVFRSSIKWLSGKRWISDRFIRIGLIGLVNCYGRKKNRL